MATVTVWPRSYSLSAIRVAIIKMHKLTQEMAAKKKQHDKLQEEVIGALGVKGLLEFGTATANYRCKVVQTMRRNIPWKELAYELAKRLFPGSEYRKWLKSLVRKYKKTAIKPFTKVTVTAKEE